MADLSSCNPWSGESLGPVPVSDSAAVRQVMADLALAAPNWAADPRRRERLLALASVCERHAQTTIDLLVREAGKTRADAETECRLLPKKITITLEAIDQRTPACPARIEPGAAHLAWRPRGLAVVLGPYNFPLHLLHGLIVPALAVGCPVVAKPSERCPHLAVHYRDLIAEAGLTEVCAIVIGAHDLAATLVDHPATRTVAAVGGTAMGRALHQRLAQRSEVVLALELGGINHALIRCDADADAAAVAVADGAWRMAGQRCTATRVVHVPSQQSDDWLRRFADLRRQWRPGPRPDSLAGPMIDVATSERFRSHFAVLPPGVTMIEGSLDGGGTRVDPLLLRVDNAAHPWLHSERFGPALVVCPYADEADAVAAMCANPLRLSCSIFTRDDAAFARLAARLPYGLVNRNRPTAGARSDLPFGGCGLSGNGRPAAVAAAQIFADETVVWG